jgi:hypothetical protein
MLAVAVLLRLMPSANALRMGSPGFAMWGGALPRSEVKKKNFIHRSQNRTKK